MKKLQIYKKCWKCQKVFNTSCVISQFYAAVKLAKQDCLIARNYGLISLQDRRILGELGRQ